MTAIEWLINELDLDNNPWNMKIINKAKEIERQQIIEFTNDFIEKHTFGDYDGNVQKNKTVNEYYNKTFKNK